MIIHTPQMNVWAVFGSTNWLEIRDYVPPEPEHFVSLTSGGLNQRRVNCTSIYDEHSDIPNYQWGIRDRSEDAFWAGLIYNEQNRLVAVHSWPSQVERDAAVKGADLVVSDYRRFRLLTLIDKRTQDA